MPKLNLNIIKKVAGAASVSIALFTYQYEGQSNTVYRDSGGIATVCVGHAYTDIGGKPLRAGQTYSDDVCSYLLGQDLAKAEKGVLADVTVPLSSGEMLAYTDFVFNLGEGAFRKSSLRRKLNAGDHAGACHGLLEWDTAKVRGRQVVLPGLKKRRTAEEGACLGITKLPEAPQ